MKPLVLFVVWLQIHLSHEQYKPDFDCIVGGTNHGINYNGTESKTENGTECVIWKFNNPNYTNLKENHKFCRNNSPTNAYKPWCYTAIQGNYWGYCDIPYCECRLRADDLYYNGTISTTRNGHTCKQWSLTKYKMELNNFCRTPNRDPFNRFGPWCFIDLHGSSEREICNVPICGAVTCPNISSPHLVTLDKKSTYRYGETAIITCENGYRFATQTVQQLHVTCEESGTWNSTIPTCEGVACSNISSPHLTTIDKKSTYRYGETAIITCEHGYRFTTQIEQQLQVTCQESGIWNSSIPTCEVESRSSSNYAWLIAPGIVVLVLAIVCVLYIKRRIKSSAVDPSENNTYVRVENEGIPVSAQPVHFNETGAESSGYYSFTSGPQIPIHAITTQNFYEYVIKEGQKGGKIEKEFSKLKRGLQQPATAALKPGNKSKNLYKDIYAYDDSRVVLEKVAGLPDSDYINASFVSGPIHIRKYIASQGPIEKTVDDFWRMVWQYDCGKIVMLTNVVEGGKIKCMQYWPESGKKQQKFGLINVLLLNENVYSDFTLRTLEMHKDNSKKTAIQFHFTSWPDKDVPKYASSLVHFKHKVTTTKVTAGGPIIVHCSAGIGRTGTFIALDYVVEQAKEHGYVDVFACVEGLRTRRVNMVQNEGQYMFLHNAILESLMCANSVIPARDFPETFKDLMRFDDTNKKHKLFIEFELMNKISPSHESSEFENGKSAENKGKNRYSNIIPVESEMPKLFTVVKGHNEYINAVFLPGHRNRKAFIITQMPLESTITDLWRLVYDYGIQTIVMLNQYNQTKETPYWPETDVPVSFGPFCIELTFNESAKLFNCLTLRLKYKKEHRQVELFQSTFWEEEDAVPKSSQNLFAFMQEIEKAHDAKENGPVLVHCLNGCDKSGLYCVMATVIERLRIQQDVDIQYTIKQMRNRRPQIIPNYEQYKFLHEAVMEYLKEFDTYVNVN